MFVDQDVSWGGSGGKRIKEKGKSEIDSQWELGCRIPMYIARVVPGFPDSVVHTMSEQRQKQDSQPPNNDLQPQEIYVYQLSR